MAEHGLLFERVALDEAETRDGQKTVVLRAHYQVSEKTSNATSLHLSMFAAVDLYVLLRRAIHGYLAADVDNAIIDGSLPRNYAESEDASD